MTKGKIMYLYYSSVCNHTLRSKPHVLTMLTCVVCVCAGILVPFKIDQYLQFPIPYKNTKFNFVCTHTRVYMRMRVYV